MKFKYVVRLHEQAKYAALEEWPKDPNRATDRTAFEAWFNREHPISKDFEEARKQLLLLSGETVTAKNAPEGTLSEDAQDRPIVRRGNRWVRVPEGQQ